MRPAALWTYQKERFPLVRTVPLLAVFSAASISVSAEMAGRPLPGWGAFAAGFAVAMLELCYLLLSCCFYLIYSAPISTAKLLPTR